MITIGLAGNYGSGKTFYKKKISSKSTRYKIIEIDDSKPNKPSVDYIIYLFCDPLICSQRAAHIPLNIIESHRCHLENIYGNASKQKNLFRVNSQDIPEYVLSCLYQILNSIEQKHDINNYYNNI